MTATTERNPYRRTPLLARLFGRRGTVARRDARAPGMDIHYIEWRGRTYIQSVTLYRGRSTLPQPTDPTTETTTQPALP